MSVSLFVFVFAFLTVACVCRSTLVSDTSFESAEAKEGGTAKLPCVLTAVHPPDKVSLVMWFRGNFESPIYKYDLREKRPVHSIDETNKYHLQLLDEERAELSVASVKMSDDGVYSCRVEFFRSPSRTTHVNLTVISFDLVGQEDLRNPLTEFLNQLMKFGEDIPFFFHAGETNWYGSITDFNLVNAVLLGTKRIGHGFAVLKHLDVAAKVKEDRIALEISSISNQVLMLIKDLRNHPGNYLIADGYPVVITNDDPRFWGTKALSYYWYMSYMSMTSRSTDLRSLKQLAINSIEYSVINNKVEALEIWEERWNDFLNEVLKNERHQYINPCVVLYHGDK